MNYSKMTRQFVCKMAMPLALMLAACSDNGNSVTKGDERSITPLGGSAEETGIIATINGFAKHYVSESENSIKSSVGPGSIIKMSELDSVTFDTTGTTYFTRCGDSTGVFSFDSIALNSPYVMLELAPYQDGDYWEWDGNWNFDEYETELEGYLTVYSVIIDVRKMKNVNINVMTYLETSRLRNLIKQGMSFDDAKRQADGELLNALGLYGDSLRLEGVSSENLLVRGLSLLMGFYREPSSAAVDLFGETGTFTAADSVKEYLIGEARSWGYNPYADENDKALLAGFLASLYGLGECSAEREGYSVEFPYPEYLFPYAKGLNIVFACSAHTWTVTDRYDVFDSVDATFGTVADVRDGKMYKTVTYNIAGVPQTWLAENLKYGSDDGLYSLSEALDLPVEYINHDKCVEQYQNHEYCNTLMMTDGVDFKSLKRSIDSVEAAAGVFKGACPEGWKLPTGNDWTVLLDYVKNNIAIEDTAWLWSFEYLARAGFESSEISKAEYVVKMDDSFTDYEREWPYEESENWAVMVDVGLGGWQFRSKVGPDDLFTVRCIKEE